MTWLVILAVGAGSFLFRLGPLLAFQRIVLTERGDRVIRHAGMAAITALITVSTKHSATGNAVAPTVLAVAAAVVLAARGASMLRLLVWGGGIYAGTVIAIELLGR
jgi:branched-subunit amino acid transport protein